MHKLRRGHICHESRGELDKANVPSELVNATSGILYAIQAPSLRRSTQAALRRPLFSFFFGFLIGMLIHLVSSALFYASSPPYWAMIVIIVAILAMIFIYWAREKRLARRHRDEVRHGG